MQVSMGPRTQVRGLPALRRRWSYLFAGAALLSALGGGAARACDLCAIYTATETQEGRTGFSIGVAEQYSYFGTLRFKGDRVANDDGENMRSSITQFLIGYNFTETLGAQINVPFISRNFTRSTADGLDHGDETGFGDMSIIAMYSPLRWVNGVSVLRGTLMAGIKLPSGSSRRLREELATVEDDPPTPQFPNIPGRGIPGFGPIHDLASGGGSIALPHSGHGEQSSGLHGHDLALGSGSVDGVLGARLFANWRRLYGSGSIQYFLRSQGSYSYQYANELLWRLGPGVFLALDDTGLGRGYTLGLAAVMSGETKGLDTLSGTPAPDTGITSFFMGPGLTFTWGESLQAILGADLPIIQNTSDLQLVQDYRIQGALTWRF